MSKKQLLEAVSPDFEVINRYILAHSRCDGRQGIENILAPWAKNKQMLFNLLGQQLVRRVDIDLEQSKDTIYDSLSRLYSFYRECGEPNFGNQKSPFVKEYLAFIDKNVGSYSDAAYALSYSLLNANAIAKDEITLDTPKKITIQSDNNPRKLILQNGMKPMRALNKVVNYFGKENFPHFEEFRLAHSNIFTSKVIKGTLVFSIHPLDYMTMSDNDNNWTTCMSWVDDGEYRLGTLEMLNSNNSLMVYLESETPYEFSPGHFWNNKSWRQIVVVDKNIILGGKSYPYTSKQLSVKILEILQGFAKENLNWKYKYGPQEYHDMSQMYGEHVHSTHKNSSKKSILFDTGFMYNDILENHTSTYYCIRNRVSKQKVISYSGKAFCLDCGEPFERRASSENLFCNECLSAHECNHCGRYIHKNETTYIVNNQKHCEDCFTRLRKCPDCGKLVSSYSSYFVFCDQEALDKALTNEWRTCYWSEIYWALLDTKQAREVNTCNECYSKLEKNGMFKMVRMSYMQKRYLDKIIPFYHTKIFERDWDNWIQNPILIQTSTLDDFTITIPQNQDSFNSDKVLTWFLSL